MNRKEFFENAYNTVSLEREKDYGDARVNFSKIAELWSAYLGTPITAVDVGLMMCLFKISRIKTGTGKIDSWIDALGYLGLSADIDKGDLKC